MSYHCARCGGYFASESLGPGGGEKYVVVVPDPFNSEPDKYPNRMKVLCLRCANTLSSYPGPMMKIAHGRIVHCVDRVSGCTDIARVICCCGALLCNNCVEAHLKWHKEAQKLKDDKPKDDKPKDDKPKDAPLFR